MRVSSTFPSAVPSPYYKPYFYRCITLTICYLLSTCFSEATLISRVYQVRFTYNDWLIDDSLPIPHNLVNCTQFCFLFASSAVCGPDRKRPLLLFPVLYSWLDPSLTDIHATIGWVPRSYKYRDNRTALLWEWVYRNLLHILLYIYVTLNNYIYIGLA